VSVGARSRAVGPVWRAARGASAVGAAPREDYSAAMRTRNRHRWLDLTVAGLMGLLLPLAPVVASLIARDRRYFTAYGRTLLRAAGHLRGQVRSAAVSRYWRNGRAPRPPERVTGACTHCGRCCLDRRCVFLDWTAQGESRCRIHGTAFWQRLACGRYPESAFHIALYDCPSFRAEPVAPPDRHETSI
jgi:hypothetical protein